MADDLQRRLAAAAAAGLMAGLSACNGAPPPNDPSGAGAADPVSPASTDDQPDETDVAAGDKGCCGPGTNACEGKGQCGTEANACRGQNSCEGKGGCFAKGCDKENSRWAKQQAEGGEAESGAGEAGETGETGETESTEGDGG